MFETMILILNREIKEEKEEERKEESMRTHTQSTSQGI